MIGDLESIELKEIESVDLVLGCLNVNGLIDLLGKLLEYDLLMISGLLVEKERDPKGLQKPLFVIYFSILSSLWYFQLYRVNAFVDWLVMVSIKYNRIVWIPCVFSMNTLKSGTKRSWLPFCV